ncbi:uncharacterized protein LOC108599419 [Drosophila busckii]|uniref:uncharacterized protein LOC108599419 n=1 Tax=Drosophila busckii TaxID=30019 RepID=UPI00083EC83D|nr:uncharacterized protein LOC108599419 [Drosophila busckii]
MQFTRTFLFVALTLVACVHAQRSALLPASDADFGAAPLSVSGSQRLNYFNQYDVAYAQPANLVSTPTGFAALPAFRFGMPALNSRFAQPAARLLTAAPFIF